MKFPSHNHLKEADGGGREEVDVTDGRSDEGESRFRRRTQVCHRRRRRDRSSRNKVSFISHTQADENVRYLEHFAEYQGDYQNYLDDNEAVHIRLNNATEDLKSLRETNIYNDTFHIS